MDMRKWFLLEDGRQQAELGALVRHIPCSDYRSPSVLKLFCAGFRCDFMLTDHTGQPTEALHLMADLMGAELCQCQDFPEDEKKAFGKDGTLMGVFDRNWYLRGLAFSDRVKAAQASTALPMGREQWHLNFLPGLDGAGINYKVDGKRRKRTCWIASCPAKWELTDDVYKGLFRWTRECQGPPEQRNPWREVPWPDAYTLFQSDPALGAAASQGATGRRSQTLRAAPAEGLQAAGGGV